jgi:hypothetical protein
MTTGIVPSSGVNTSALGSSFYTHQRQKSGGVFTQGISNLKAKSSKLGGSIGKTGLNQPNNLQPANSSLLFRGSAQ